MIGKGGQVQVVEFNCRIGDPADGYTLLVSSSSIAISPALYKNLNFDIRRDFACITLIASQPLMRFSAVVSGSAIVLSPNS